MQSDPQDTIPQMTRLVILVIPRLKVLCIERTSRKVITAYITYFLLATMVGLEGFEPTTSDFVDRRSDPDELQPHNLMVSERGFEPRTPRPERGMFPLHHSEMVGEGRFELPPLAPKARMQSLTLLTDGADCPYRAGFYRSSGDRYDLIS